ncbi:MAG: ABC transporter substrate-binding protein [Peptococcaceae bacterium]|nr:ABC transporter substrate-binding protein [Peptococcaceae bacterium]
MRKIKQKAALGLALTLIAGVVLTGCGTTSTPTAATTSSAATTTSTTPQRGGIFANWMKDDPKSLDPAHDGDTQSYDVQMNIYDGLLMFDKTGQKVVPDLATSMPVVSNNGLTYTFQLRQGVKFHNGDPFTADDVVYSFNRLAAKNTASEGEAYYSAIKGMDDVFAGKATSVAGVVKKGEYTVEFDLTAPSRTFLDVIAMPYAFIVDKKYTSGLANQSDLSAHPIGTGPFKFVEWNKGQDIKLVRNDNYFLKDANGQQLPYLNGITWSLGYDTPVAFLKFKNGQQDYSWIPTSDFVTTLNDPKLKPDIESLVQNDYWYFAANNKVAPFNKLKVRQALEYGIDKDAILKLINNRGVVANEILPPNMPAYKANPAGYTYDVAKAKQLLSEAGYPNGLPGTYPIIYRQSQITDTIMANIQAQLATLGIKVTLQAVPFPEYLNVVTQGKGILLLGHWAQDYPDPDDFLNVLFNTAQIPSNNIVEYSNPNVDKQLNALGTQQDLQKAIPGYQAVEKQIMEDAAVVPLYHDQVSYVVQPWVHNAELHSVYPYFYYLTMWIDQNAKQAGAGK